MIMKGPLENKVLIVQVPKALQFAFKSLKRCWRTKSQMILLCACESKQIRIRGTEKQNQEILIQWN